MTSKRKVQNPDAAALLANKQPSHLETGGIKAAAAAAAAAEARNKVLLSQEDARIAEIKAYHVGVSAETAEWCYRWRTFNLFRAIDNPKTGATCATLAEWISLRFGVSDDKSVKGYRNTFDYLARRHTATIDATGKASKASATDMDRAMKYLLGGKAPLFGRLSLTEQHTLIVNLNKLYEVARKAANTNRSQERKAA